MRVAGFARRVDEGLRHRRVTFEVAGAVDDRVDTLDGLIDAGASEQVAGDEREDPARGRGSVA